jgi:hypothetical protein
MSAEWESSRTRTIKRSSKLKTFFYASELPILFVQLGLAFCLQCIDGLAHRLGGNMDQSSKTSLQFEDHSYRAGYSYCAECQGDRRGKIARGEQAKTGEQ